VVEQDVGVFEEPGTEYHDHGNAHQAGLCGNGEQKGEDNQQRRGSAADRTEEVAEDVQMQLIHSMIRDDKIAEKPKHSYLSLVNRS